MKYKRFWVLILCSFVSLAEAVTLEVEVVNQCSGGFVVHIGCKNAVHRWRGVDFKQTEKFNLPSIQEGTRCIVDNTWEGLLVGSHFSREASVKLPLGTQKETLKATVVFQNHGLLNLCAPVNSEIIAN